MANSTIPGLVAVSVPALTDLFGVRQSGDARDKKLTVTQLLTLIPSGGDVTKVGTPSVNQVGVWTGDGTIEGTSGFVFNESAGLMSIVLSDELRLTGDLRLLTGSGQGPIIQDILADGTTPTLCPASADRNTGIGWRSADRLSLVSGGKAGLILAESNSIGVIPNWDTTTGITAFATGGQGSAVVLNRGYNVATTVATTGDSVKLPTGLGFLKGAVVYIKNDGANSLDLFPGVGDDLGAGLNTAIAVAAGKSVAFLGTIEESTWTQLIFEEVAGGGDVTKVGTPANNQLGVWTGDGTLEGDTSWQVVGSALQGVLGSGPEMRNVAGVNIHPRKGDTDTGIASRGDNRLAMVAQGVDGIKLIGASTAILQQHNTTVGLTAFAGGGQGSATQLNSSYSVVDTVATTGDSVKFSTTLEVGVVNYVKNDGANALDLFPAAGDDLGNGVGVAISVSAGASVAFIGTVTGSVSTQFIFESGVVDISDLTGGANNGMLFKTGGVWTDTQASGLEYDGASMAFDGVDIDFTGGGGINVDDAGNIQIVGTGQLILPTGSSAGLPELKIGSGQTGFFTASATQLRITVNGTERFTITNDIIQGFLAGSGQLHNRVSSATVPTFTPNTNDGDTGIGGPGGDVLSLIAGGVEIARASEGTNDQFLVISGVAAGPGIGFLSDPDTGFFLANTGTIEVSLAGTSHFEFLGTSFGAKIAGGARIVDELPSATNPSFVPNKSDTDTGIGWTSADILSLIAGAVEGLTIAESGGVITLTFRGDLQAAGGGGAGPMMRNVSASPSVPTLIPNQADPNTGLTRSGIDEVALVAGGLDVIRCGEVGGAETIGFYTTAAIAKQTGVAVSSAGIHAALVALGLISA